MSFVNFTELQPQPQKNSQSSWGQTKKQSLYSVASAMISALSQGDLPQSREELVLEGSQEEEMPQ